MSRLEELIPHYIRSMARYVPGKSLKQAERESGKPSIKLASNENPFGPSPMAIEAIRRAAGEVHSYPETESPELRQALAAKHGVAADHVFVTAATSSLLRIIGYTFLSPGLNAITSELSFISYPILAQAAGATMVKVPARNHGYDLEGILAAINSDTRVILLANPNNPTGSFIPVEEVDRFLDRVPPHVLVVLDEAYSDFAEAFAAERGVEYSHGLRYVQEGRNVVVARTFSKAQGLAGLRLGYGLGHPDLLQHFDRVKTVFSVSTVAEAAGIAALQDHHHIQRTISNNLSGAKYLTEKLTEIGHKVLPTWANFLYVDVGEDSMTMAKRLEAEGVIVRPLTGWGAPTAIRVSIGTPEQNQTFIAAMKKLVGAAVK
ncbi:MAG TPA: histidinol-phosphate transaminase [Terriglobales bacterium]|nr:histidinol-phosphate transaminase [Terriglobales bacterium]